MTVYAIIGKKGVGMSLFRLTAGLCVLRCWWFGHEQHPQDLAPPDYATCMHCGEYMSYGEMVGDTRHNRMVDWLRHSLYRRWVPAKCAACGSLFRHRNACDGIPF